MLTIVFFTPMMANVLNNSPIFAITPSLQLSKKNFKQRKPLTIDRNEMGRKVTALINPVHNHRSLCPKDDQFTGGRSRTHRSNINSWCLQLKWFLSRLLILFLILRPAAHISIILTLSLLVSSVRSKFGQIQYSHFIKLCGSSKKESRHIFINSLKFNLSKYIFYLKKYSVWNV